MLYLEWKYGINIGFLVKYQADIEAFVKYQTEIDIWIAIGILNSIIQYWFGIKRY